MMSLLSYRGQGLEGRLCLLFPFLKNLENKEKYIKYSSRKAFSVAEAMIALLLVSVTLAASAPLISKQMQNSNLSNIEMRRLAQRIEELEANAGTPVGAVMAFDLEACPSGWHPLTETYAGADGAFIRNLGGNALARGVSQLDAAPNITGRFPTNIRDQYANAQPDGAFSFSADQGNFFGWPNGKYWGFFINYSAANSSAVYGRDDSTEVRPRNIALLYCRKHDD